MKKKPQNKLQLSKIMISNLSASGQQKIVGGATGYPCEGTLTCPTSYANDCPQPITYLISYCRC